MALITLSYVFAAGNTIIASQHNTNNSTIYNAFNGGIDTTNISPTAGILGSQLSSSAGILGSQLSASAGIAGTQIASLSATQLTGLVPTANLASGTATSSTALLGNQTWGTLNTGALTLISATTVTSTTTSGNISITIGNYYKVVVIGVDVSGVTNSISLGVNADTGNNYYGGFYGMLAGTSFKSVSYSGVGSIAFGSPITESNYFNTEFTIYPVTGTHNAFVFGTTAAYFVPGAQGAMTLGGQYLGSSAVSSFVINGTGNWTGVVYLYQLTL